MDGHIFIAVIGALINMALSVTVPCFVKKSELPFLTQVKQVYETNRQLVIASSIIVGLTLYLALKVAPEVQSVLSDLSSLNLETSSMPSFNRSPIIVSRMSGDVPDQLKNLMRLMH